MTGFGRIMYRVVCAFPQQLNHRITTPEVLRVRPTSATAIALRHTRHTPNTRLSKICEHFDTYGPEWRAGGRFGKRYGALTSHNLLRFHALILSNTLTHTQSLYTLTLLVAVSRTTRTCYTNRNAYVMMLMCIHLSVVCLCVFCDVAG